MRTRDRSGPWGCRSRSRSVRGAARQCLHAVVVWLLWLCHCRARSCDKGGGGRVGQA